MSHHWNDQPVNQPQAPQRSTMPTFLAVENEGPDDQDKGKAPETGSDKEGEDFSRTILVAMQDIAREIKEMRLYRLKGSPGRFHLGESSVISHH